MVQNAFYKSGISFKTMYKRPVKELDYKIHIIYKYVYK